MRSGTRKIQAVAYAIAMLMLIIDAKTALAGAKEGVTLCLYTVIPSLFPFIFISILLSGTLVGASISLLRPIGQACGIPRGAESFLILGIIGGYPVGAQNIAYAYNNGQLNKNDARRLLGFCNNAGPAFIFGIMSPLFRSSLAPFLLWLVHIVSAIAVGMILPHKSHQYCTLPQKEPPSLTKALIFSIKTMAEICGWIILFRIILSILQHWLFWALPENITVIVYGVTELTNGCVELFHHSPEGFRFILSSVFLGFGGLCVAMQTVSVTKGLGTGLYFPGKVLQTIIGFFLALLLQSFILPEPERIKIPVYLLISAACLFVGLLYRICFRKKVVENLCAV